MNIKKLALTVLTVVTLFAVLPILPVAAIEDGFGVSDSYNSEWVAETNANIFHTLRYDNNLLYPGSGSTYTFTVQNTGEKYTKCQLTITDKNEYKLPLEFKLKKNGEYIIGTETEWYSSPALDTGLIEYTGTDTYDLEWRWQYLTNNAAVDNVYDTEIGERAFYEEEPYFLNIKVYAEGGTDEPVIEPSPDPSEPTSEPTSEPESEPTNPSEPSDTVTTGDKSYNLVGIFLTISIVSLLVAVIGGRLREKTNKK